MQKRKEATDEDSIHVEITLALRLDPNSPHVRMRYAVSGLMPHGRVQESAAELKRALKPNRISLLMRMWFGIMLILLRDYEHGIELTR